MEAKATAPTHGMRPTKPPSRPDEEAARLGEAIYDRDIRHQVEPEHVGEIVAIDVDTGHWAIGENVLAATDHLWEKHPDAYDTWCIRIGYRALRNFGGGVGVGLSDQRLRHSSL